MLHILYTSINYTIHGSEKVLGQQSLYCEGDNFEQEDTRMTKLFSTVRSRKRKNSIGNSHYTEYQLGLQTGVHAFSKISGAISKF
jgi:hypothetical protein